VCRLKGLPNVIWYHGADIHGNRPEGAGEFLKFLLRLVWRFRSMHCFVSNGIKGMAIQYGLSGPCAIVPVMPCAIKSAAEYRPFTGMIKTFLFAGRMEPVKNPLLLIHAIRILEKGARAAGMHFKFVGYGALYDEVCGAVAQYGLANKVTVASSVPPSEMFKLFSEAYALMLPSRIEASPITVLEAGLMGVPTIGSNAVGINEAVLHNETGLLFRENDPQELAAAISALARDSAMRDALGAGAARRARQFTAAYTAQSFLAVLDKARAFHVPDLFPKAR
jgi:glycosyltransferase involved in cell wall biosynthesis